MKVKNNSKMSIMVAVPELDKFGAGRFIQATIEHLKRENNVVIIDRSKLKKQKIQTRELFQLVKRRIIKYKIEKIILNGFSEFYKLLKPIKKKFPKIELIDVLHNDSIKAHFGNHLRKHHFFTKIICVNDQIAEKLKNITNASIYKITPCYWEQIAKINYNPTKKYDIIFVGRASKEKNPNLLIKLLKKLQFEYKQKKSKINCLIVSSGPFENKVKSQCLEIDNEDFRIIYKKYLSHRGILNAFSESRICINTSTIEGFPLSLAEAYAQGCPFLSFHNPGRLYDFIKKSPQNIKFTRFNVSSFSKKVIQEIESCSAQKQKEIVEYARKNIPNKKEWNQRLNLVVSDLGKTEKDQLAKQVALIESKSNRFPQKIMKTSLGSKMYFNIFCSHRFSNYIIKLTQAEIHKLKDKIKKRSKRCKFTEQIYRLIGKNSLEKNFKLNYKKEILKKEKDNLLKKLCS
jgi:glycosyltransferase involved in cell wall biosynthesis